MRLLANFSTGEFNAFTDGVKAVGTQVKKIKFPAKLAQVKQGVATGMQGIRKTVAPAASAIEPGNLKDLQALADDAKAYRQGTWGKLGVVANTAAAVGTPLALAPLVMESADVKATKKLREQDLQREAQGLPPLSKTVDMIKNPQAPVPPLPEKQPRFSNGIKTVTFVGPT